MEIKRDLNKYGAGKTVLIADDSAHIRKALTEALLTDGFKTCIEAENGKEAIEAAQQIRPDVMILDLSMPTMNGLQAAFELRRLFQDIPIILFTMYGNSFKKEASRAGVNVVMDKSEPIQALISKAQELAGN